MHGILVVDKPSGPTSFDVVRQVRHWVQEKKAGHTGTLDPMATGLLPICLGDATKAAGFILEGDKGYDAVIRLGVETDTQDAEGKVTAQAPVPALSRELLEGALQAFRGPLMQLPPMFSAVKVDGKRLYEHARAGEEIERKPRAVTVHALELKDFSSTELTLSARCSKGFFVRTLAFDLGRALGCGAHLKALRRTATGPFTLRQALPLDKLQALAEAKDGLAEIARRLVSVSDALVDIPAFKVSAADAVRVGHGVPLEAPAAPGKLRVVNPEGALLAIAEVDHGRLRYLRVFSEGAR